MAQRGTPLSGFVVRLIEQRAAEGVPLKRIARDLGLSRRTVQKYAHAPHVRLQFAHRAA